MAVTQDSYSSFLGEHITGTMEVKVWSNSIGAVGYGVDELRVSRSWQPSELKIVTFHELYLLANQPGGMALLTNYLQIRDQKVREALQLPLEPEYLYTDEDAKKLVISGTEDQILDALEFGPISLAGMIRHYAILEVTDINRMKFFNNLFSMSIEVIRDNMRDESEGTDEANKPTGQRRVQVNQETAETKPSPTRERKGSALEPSEPTVQEATEE
jgi:hypothetical protein